MFAMMTGAASAQSRTFYDAGGKVIAAGPTNSSGSTTNYDARGKVISRETTTGNTTTRRQQRRKGRIYWPRAALG